MMGKKQQEEQPQPYYFPASEPAEVSLLGSIILDAGACAAVRDFVSPDDFYFQPYKALAQVIWEMWDAGKTVDAVTLYEVARSRGILPSQEQAVDTLFQLAETVPDASDAEHYAKIIRANALRRQSGNIAKELQSAVSTDPITWTQKLQESQQQIQDLLSKNTGIDLPKPLPIAEANRQIQEAEHAKPLVTGLTSGLPKLDKYIGGFYPGEMTIIAGRPSEGKTSLSLNIGLKIALEGKNILLFMLESAEIQIARNILSIYSKVSPEKIRSGYPSREEKVRIDLAAGVLADRIPYAHNKLPCSIAELQAITRRLHRRHKLDLLVIDYLQLLYVDGKVESRQQEVTAISHGIKALAKELDIPIIAVSQLSRAGELRKNPAPILSDLRESGAIEQDADVVIFIYRADKDSDNETRLRIAKQRHGATGEIRTVFLRECLRFGEIQFKSPPERVPALSAAESGSSPEADSEHQLPPEIERDTEKFLKDADKPEDQLPF